MFKNGMFWICLLLSGFQIHANVSTEHQFERTKNQIVVSLDQLVFDQEAIFVNIEGSWLPINSIEKIDGKWMAGIDIALNYCPRGDPLCKKCGLCHRQGCYYYVPQCK